jgi:hypothetical protein
MDKIVFSWKEYGASVIIDKSVHGKVYGFYLTKKGDRRFRNYHRELKNGRGLTLVDIASDIYFRKNDLLSHMLNRKMFSNG